MGLLDEVLGGVLNQLGGQPGQGAPAGRGAGGMGGLGGMLGGGGSSGGGAKVLMMLLPVVLQMLQQNRGGASSGGAGLGGLLAQFQAAGLGSQADSWVGTGENLPLSAEQLQQALGPGQVKQIAAQAGMSEAEASAGLAGLLPNLVNGLTPQGRLPEPGSVEQDLSALLGQLSAR